MNSILNVERSKKNYKCLDSHENLKINHKELTLLFRKTHFNRVKVAEQNSMQKGKILFQ